MKLKSFYLFPFFIFLWGCANMLAPTGGPKDEKPPKITGSEPANNQTSYQKSYIKLTFDEYISIDNLNNELIVSPPLKYKPTSKISGKKAIIEWKDTLEPNSTYTFNFGKSIKDINEGNVLENFTITFSTGEEIDSAEYSGKIVLADKEEVLKSAFVYLSEKPFSDSSFFPVKAQYQTKTNSQGFFVFQGLKPAKYYLYFLDDQNSNKSADQGEYLGFADTQIVVKYSQTEETTDSSQKNISHSEPDVFYAFPYFVKGKKVFKSSIADNSGQISLQWQDNVFYPSPIVKTMAGASLLSLNNNDTLLVFINDMDSFQLRVQNTKGENLYLSDSLVMPKKIMPLRFFASKQDICFRDDSVYKITSNHIIQSIDTSKVSINYDTLNIQPKITFKNHEIHVLYPFQEGKKYEIKLGDSAIRYGDTFWNKKPQTFVKEVPEKRIMSNYELKFNRISEAFLNTELIIEITYNNEKFYRYLKKEDSILVLPNILPGSYSLRIIADKNANGIWDTGDITNKTQAETILKITKPIEVKKGWDGDAEIKL